MGIPTNIKTLLSGLTVEWARVEFKESWNPETSLKTICAFANDIDNWGGGYLVIGVEEIDGRPVNLRGVPPEKVDSILKDLLNKCKLLQPDYTPITEVAQYQGKTFIVVWAPGGSVRPYSAPKSLRKNSYEGRICWIRKMASTIAPSEEELRDLYSLANNIPFDDRVNHEAEITDLNITLIQSYLKSVGSSLYEDSKTIDFVDLCKSMNIVSSLPEYTKPKNVGLLFFSLEPEKFFPYAQIDVVQFPDDLGGDTIIEKIFKGPLHIQLKEALQYISNAIIQEKVIKHPDVPEADRFFNYPFAAIEEALSNAVYHKGYDVREPIEVRVLPDRIEIVSHPGADRSVTLDGLKSYHVFCRRYRNRRVGDFLKELHFTEGRNTGFRKIINAIKKNGSPEPLFETDDYRTYFATTFHIHPAFLEENKQDGAQNKTLNVVDEKAAEVEDDNTAIKYDNNTAIKYDNKKELSNRQSQILNIIAQNPNARSEEIGLKLGISSSYVRDALKVIEKKGFLKRIGSKKTGHWEVVE